MGWSAHASSGNICLALARSMAWARRGAGAGLLGQAGAQQLIQRAEVIGVSATETLASAATARCVTAAVRPSRTRIAACTIARREASPLSRRPCAAAPTPSPRSDADALRRAQELDATMRLL